jgi:hypothetical protein
MRVLLQEDDPLARSVQQQLGAGHAWTCRHINSVDGVDISALKETILFCVDGFTPIKVRPTRRLSARASIRMRTTHKDIEI